MQIFMILTAFLVAIALIAPLPASASTSNVDQAACARMKTRGVLGNDAPVGCSKLAIIRFSYVDFDGQRHTDGEVMVMAAAAAQVQAILDALYSRGFPIARAKLMDHYSGDDVAAMRDNNTSAFNHRSVTGGKRPSLHAYGLAIDINPVQNPYIELHSDGRAMFSPPSGTKYANRSNLRPAKAVRSGMAEEVIEIFAQNGFLVWGGDWDAPIDYQHFQVERKMAERMAALTVNQARAHFTEYVQRYRTCLSKDPSVHKKTGRAQCMESLQR